MKAKMKIAEMTKLTNMRKIVRNMKIIKKIRAMELAGITKKAKVMTTKKTRMMDLVR